MKNLIIALNDHPTAQKIRTILNGSGIPVAGVCTTAAQTILLARRLQGTGLVICQSRFTDQTADFVAEQLLPDYEFLVLTHGDLKAAYAGKGMYSLHLPLMRTDLIDSVRMLLAAGTKPDGSPGTVKASQVNKEDREKGKEKKNRSMEEIKLIEDAKNVLMVRNNLTEEQAHRFLQKKSMDSGCRLTDTARTIIDGW
ncbi:MAG: ANTAR domain-containing response regulator [Saccharofermentanales bacterium]